MPYSNLQWPIFLWITEIQVISGKNRDAPFWVEWKFICSLVIYTFMNYFNGWGVLASILRKWYLMLVQLKNLWPYQCPLWGCKTWYLMPHPLLNSPPLLDNIILVYHSIHQNLIHQWRILYTLLYFQHINGTTKIVLWLTLWRMNAECYEGQHCVVFMHMYHIPTMSFMTSAR